MIKNVKKYKVEIKTKLLKVELYNYLTPIKEIHANQ